MLFTALCLLSFDDCRDFWLSSERRTWHDLSNWFLRGKTTFWLHVMSHLNLLFCYWLIRSLQFYVYSNINFGIDRLTRDEYFNRPLSHQYTTLRSSIKYSLPYSRNILVKFLRPFLLLFHFFHHFPWTRHDDDDHYLHTLTCYPCLYTSSKHTQNLLPMFLLFTQEYDLPKPRRLSLAGDGANSSPPKWTSLFRE